MKYLKLQLFLYKDVEQPDITSSNFSVWKQIITRDHLSPLGETVGETQAPQKHFSSYWMWVNGNTSETKFYFIFLCMIKRLSSWIRRLFTLIRKGNKLTIFNDGTVELPHTIRTHNIRETMSHLGSRLLESFPKNKQKLRSS